VLDRARARLVSTVGVRDFTDASIDALLGAAASDPDGFRLLFQHAAREPEFRAEMDQFRAGMVAAAHRQLAQVSPIRPGRGGPPSSPLWWPSKRSPPGWMPASPTGHRPPTGSARRWPASSRQPSNPDTATAHVRRHGRRRLFLAGLALLAAASLLAGLGSTPGGAAGRLGAAGHWRGPGDPATLAIIPATFPDARQRNLAVAAWSAVAALALAVGAACRRAAQPAPALGLDLCHQRAGRRGHLTLAALRIPASRDRTAARSLDLAGLVTATVALFGVTYALSEGHDAGWTSPAILAAATLPRPQAAPSPRPSPAPAPPWSTWPCFATGRSPAGPWRWPYGGATPLA
jgi:hypothetical protein